MSWRSFGIVMAAVLYLLAGLSSIGTSQPADTVPQAQPAATLPASPAGASDIYAFIRSKNVQIYPQLAELITAGTFSACEEFGLHPPYLVALMDVESDFRPHVVSKARAVGLTQVHVPTWIEDKKNPHNLISVGILSAENDLYDPAKNIRAGAYILNHYMREAVRRQDPHPLRYALTRYLGGTQNEHFTNFRIALADYYLFTQADRR